MKPLKHRFLVAESRDNRIFVVTVEEATEDTIKERYPLTQYIIRRLS